MRTKTFKQWNWQFDYGVGEFCDGDPLPAKHADAFYEQFDRLYRVELRERSFAVSGGDGFISTTIAYDYFRSKDGEILQKRSRTSMAKYM